MDVQRQIRGFLDDLEDDDPELTAELAFYLCRNGYEIDDSEPVVQAVENAHLAVFGERSGRPEPYRYDVSADTSILTSTAFPRSLMAQVEYVRTVSTTYTTNTES